MDPQAFRETLQELQPRDCHFQKLIFSGRCNCRHAERFCLAEREGIRCLSQDGNLLCQNLLRQLTDKSRFLLRQRSQTQKPGHAQQLRLQRGLIDALRDLNREPGCDDIIALLMQSQSDDGIAWEQVLPRIAAQPARGRRER